VLAGSRRGGRVHRIREATSTTDAGPSASQSSHQIDGSTSRNSPARHANPSHEHTTSEDSDEEVAQLRNPSDAIQFLAEGEDSAGDPLRSSASPSKLRHRISITADQGQRVPPDGPPDGTPVVDEYELVERGLLNAGTILELLTMWASY
jgi:hypothetical protein